MRYLLDNSEVRSWTTQYIRRYLLETPRFGKYLGWRKYIRYHTPFQLDIPWGWKSPLNTFTLPIWLDLFPNAKVVHIYRHGVDVANSLQRRGRKEMQSTALRALYYKFPLLHVIKPKAGGFIPVRCDSLEGGLSLWEEYLAEAGHHVRSLGIRAFELKYETFLAEPNQILNELSRFCGLQASEIAIRNAVATVQKERAYAYQESPDLRAFAERVPDRLHAYGY